MVVTKKAETEVGSHFQSTIQFKFKLVSIKQCPRHWVTPDIIHSSFGNEQTSVTGTWRFGQAGPKAQAPLTTPHHTATHSLTHSATTDF